MKCLSFIALTFFLSTSFAKSNVAHKKEVQRWIKVFQKNKLNYFNSWLKKSELKMPKIKALLKRQGLPEDLAYLPIIESGLNPKAVSSAQAVGYWQFIQPTAEAYDLKINWWLDERHDLIKSTWAAARYLKKLYYRFDDWYLALAAYNMGETRLARLIKKHKTRDFWKLSKLKGFPKESREYVPKFLAAALIVKNPTYYGFKTPHVSPMQAYTYQYVPGGTDLYQVAKKLDITPKKFKELNPELKRFFIPDGVSSHRIRVPKGFKRRVALYLSTQIR